jgi:hypothetical protein
VKYRNNLTDESSNAYFRVVESFDCYVRVGLSDSNTYAGRSMVCGNVYRKVTLKRGDEIHDLFGGVFVVREGAREALIGRMLLPSKHPFERGSDPEGAWPLDKLKRVDVGSKVDYARNTPKMSPGVLCANGIDSVVP